MAGAFGKGIKELFGKPLLNDKGKPDPEGQFIETPLTITKGSDIRSAISNVYRPVVEAFSLEEELDPRDITSPQKTVNPERVAQFLDDPSTVAVVAQGRSGNDLLVVKYKGKYAVIDGNHRVVAALLAGEKVKAKVVDMDLAFDEAAKIDDPRLGQAAKLLEAAENYKAQVEKTMMVGKGEPSSTNPRDILSRHQVYLERLKSGYVLDYDEALREVDKAIQSVLNSLKVEKLSELGQASQKKLLADLRAVQAPIYAKQGDKLMEELEKLSEHEALFEKQLISNVAEVAGLKKSVIKKAKDAWKFLITKPIQATGDLLEPFVKDLSTRQIARINKEIMISVGQGRTISQTVQAIRGTKARNFRDGIIDTNARDARTIVRTATQHVSQQAREATWEANSDLIDRYQIVATLDGKTSTQCKSLDQQVFVIGQGPTPPLHPNCRTTTVPYFKPSIWDQGATRSAEFGPVDQSTTYYEWLGKQPKAFQDDALGPTRGKLFRDGGLSSDEFAKLQLDKNFQPLTLDEMKRLNPNAFEQANI